MRPLQGHFKFYVTFSINIQLLQSQLQQKIYRKCNSPPFLNEVKNDLLKFSLNKLIVLYLHSQKI